MSVNAPQTGVGRHAWDIGERCWGQIRTAGLGHPLGLDLTPALTLAGAEGADMRAMAVLLPAYSDGMAEGIAKVIARKRGDAADE